MTTEVGMKFYKVRRGSDGDCDCGLLCQAALEDEPGRCPRVYQEEGASRLIELATREPVKDYDAARKTLETAAEYVSGPRSRYYGHPLDNHGRTAILVRAYLFARFAVDLDITEEDVCWLNVQQKVARDMNAPVEDGPIDVAGYAANVAEIRATRERRAA